MKKVTLFSDGKGLYTRLTGVEAQAHKQLARAKEFASMKLFSGGKPYKPRKPAPAGVRVWCSSTDYYTT